MKFVFGWLMIICFLGLVTVTVAQDGDKAELEQTREKLQEFHAVKKRFIWGLIKNISHYYYENKDVTCFWNKWEDRDARAHIERTYNSCRYSYVKRTWGRANGRWYCLWKQAACKAKGYPLD